MGAADVVADIKGDLASANAAMTAGAPPAAATEPPVTPEAAAPTESDPKVPTS
jgi:microcompartment protein CcmL/EutN